MVETADEVVAHQFVAMRFDQFGKCGAFERTVLHHGFMAGHGGEFPGFPYVVALRRNSFESGDSFASPYHGLEVAVEFKNR